MIYRIVEGLGDCIIVGAVLEHSNLEEVKFFTSPKIHFLFKDHPKIKIVDHLNDEVFNFKWVSQMNDKSLYDLHTMQRFSTQLEYLISPRNTLSIYKGKDKVLNAPVGKKICINRFSAEKHRRYIPDECLKLILEKFKDYEIVYLGHDGISNIEEANKHIIECSLFIGPVSFYYHLAECYNTKCLLFTGYMPPSKFSHFKNTIAIHNYSSACSMDCEKSRDQCFISCDALKYKLNTLETYLDMCKTWIK